MEVRRNMNQGISRRKFLMGTGAGAVMLSLGACGPQTQSPSGSASNGGGMPQMPSQPVTLTLIDVAGNLQGSKGMIDAYVE